MFRKHTGGIITKSNQAYNWKLHSKLIQTTQFIKRTGISPHIIFLKMVKHLQCIKERTGWKNNVEIIKHTCKYCTNR